MTISASRYKGKEAFVLASGQTLKGNGTVVGSLAGVIRPSVAPSRASRAVWTSSSREVGHAANGPAGSGVHSRHSAQLPF